MKIIVTPDDWSNARIVPSAELVAAISTLAPGRYDLAFTTPQGNFEVKAVEVPEELAPVDPVDPIEPEPIEPEQPETPVEPAPVRLYAGQMSAAIPGIATATNTASYTTGSGTISSAQLQVNGENTTTAAVLSEGDVVSVLVTTSTSLTRRWVLSTVEYGLQILSKGAAGWSVKINDLIRGATSVTLG